MTWYHTANMVVSSTFYVLVSVHNLSNYSIAIGTEILLFLKAGMTRPLHSVKVRQIKQENLVAKTKNCGSSQWAPLVRKAKSSMIAHLCPLPSKIIVTGVCAQPDHHTWSRHTRPGTRSHGQHTV